MENLSALALEPVVIKNIEKWLSGNYDVATKNEIKKLIEDKNTEELTNAFYKDLEFGTGGLRGIMGVGTNKMNKYTIAAATQGLSNYLKKSFPGEQLKVAIAFDSRNNSKAFAKITADTFSANGIKVYLFEELRPTPELSFTIRHFGCHSGVVLTASHNPKEYNGYKAYWQDGAQMVAPHDTNVIEEVQRIASVDEIKLDGNSSLIQIIGKEIDKEYIEKTASLSVAKEAIRRQKNLKIVYTPIHGSGITVVPEMLRKFGFENIHVVEEQSIPDGNFPSVIYPNPEEKDALNLAIEKAKALDADLVMATDPDADRVGIAIKNSDGQFQLLNGNQTGSLLIYYLLSSWKEAGKITGKEYVVKTIVTTDLISNMANAFGVKNYDTLTGFKFIAEVIRNLEGKETFIGGGEESYGYLVGDFVRDKDAVNACAFIAEMVAWAKDKGSSLYETMVDMYVAYGFYKESLISITKKGKTGAEEIKQMMKNLRENPPLTVAGSKILKICDYENIIQKDLITGNIETLPYPKSDVLQFIAEDGTKISARPSGTEPKIKFYFSVNEKLRSKEEFKAVEMALDQKIKQVIKDLGIE
jgi:phosphoglucomutase